MAKHPVETAASFTPRNIVLVTLARHSYFFIAAVVLLSFGASVFNGYNIDDEYVVEDHKLVEKGLEGIPEIFTQPYIVKRGESYEYRPIAIATFAMEYFLFRGNIFINHLVNILLYIACTILLYRILLSLLGGTFPAVFILLITAAWAAHPVHVEVVCSLKNREEILSFLFAFLAVLILIRSSKNQLTWYEYFGAFLCVILSLLSKRSAVPFLGISALAGLYFYLNSRPKNKTVGLMSAMIIITSGIFSVVNIYYSKRQINFFEDPMVKMQSLGEIISYKLSILPAYFKLLIFPKKLAFYYGYNAVPYGSWNSIYPYIGLSVILLTIIPLWLLRKKKIYLWSLLFLYGTLSLYLLISYTGIISERALFITVLPFVFIVSYVLLLSFREQSKGLLFVIYFLLFLTLAYTARSAHRSVQWRDKKTLLSADVGHLEKSYLANFIYASHLYNRLEEHKTGDTAVTFPIAREALKHYKLAVNIFPTEDFLTYIHMGDINFKYLRDFPAAAENYNSSIQLGVREMDIYLSLGMAAFKAGQYDRSRQALDIVLSRDSGNQDALYFNIQNLLHLNQIEHARSLQNTYVSLYRTLYRADLNEGRIALREGRIAAAIQHFEDAVAKGMTDKNILRNLSNYYGSRGDRQKQQYYRSLAEQAQNDPKMILQD